MTTGGDEQQAGLYAPMWDGYVRAWSEINASYGGHHEWPGDEWGTPESWEAVFQGWFVPAGVATWNRAVEIGAGSGKYTVKVLGRSEATVRAYDVSAEYQRVCARRCQEWIDSGRLSLHHLPVQRPDQMLIDLREAGWARTVDAFYSIDAMVHVDLQYLIAYVLTAGLTLKPGGKLILTLADATSRDGFRKLLQDIAAYYPLQGKPSSKFEWLDAGLVRSVLMRLGFEIDTLMQAERDLYVIANLAAPDISERFCRFLQLDGDEGVAANS